MTAALSWYADSTPSGASAWVFLIMANRERSEGTSSTVQSALKILWRQCSEFAWANIISSTSVGSRSRVRKLVTR